MKKEISLELTSLLDVILILLFLFMAQNGRQTEAAENALNEANAALDAVQDRLADAERTAMAYAELDDRADIITVTVSKMSEGRRISVIRENVGGDGYRSDIDFDWDNVKYAKNALNTEFRTLASDRSPEKPLFVMFLYDSGEIYNSDFQMINEAVSKLSEEYDGIFTAASDIGRSGGKYAD